MKLLIFTLLFISVFSESSKETFGIENRSGQEMQLRVWRDSKLVYDLTLHHGDQLDVRIGSGILLQWRFECDRTDLYNSGEKHIGNGWIEVLVTKDFSDGGFEFVDRKCREKSTPKA